MNNRQKIADQIATKNAELKTLLGTLVQQAVENFLKGLDKDAVQDIIRPTSVRVYTLCAEILRLNADLYDEMSTDPFNVANKIQGFGDLTVPDFLPESL